MTDIAPPAAGDTTAPDEGPATTATSVPPATEAAPGRRRWRRWAGAMGPAFVVSMAYVDPGNFATNTAAGAQYGFLLLWVIAGANVLAMFIQYLSSKVGIATGRSLPELCREHCPRPVARLLWLQAECVAVATDLAELIGGAVALNLLFGVPLIPGLCITAVVALLLLVLAPQGRHRFETVLAGMLLVVLAGFTYQALAAAPPAEAAAGFLPGFAGADSVLLATGIIGATVMPHVIYLHSALTRHHHHTSAGRRRRALRTGRFDILVALALAGAANMTMLVVAAAAFHGTGRGDITTLGQAHAGLGQLLGAGAALAFALALLASGLASSSVGTYAGQIIMEGFLRRRIPLLLRRAATLVPAMGLLVIGLEPTRALILSQVVLSFGIPFALVPLTLLTSSRRVMGDMVNRRATTAVAVTATMLICGLNLFLLAQPLLG